MVKPKYLITAAVAGLTIASLSILAERRSSQRLERDTLAALAQEVSKGVDARATGSRR